MGRKKGDSPRSQREQQKQAKAITKELVKRGVPLSEVQEHLHEVLHDNGLGYANRTVIRMILFIGQKMNRGDLKCFGIN